MQRPYKACILMWFLGCLLLSNSFAQDTGSPQPVRATLNVIDETTAAELFGKQTSREFFAVRVRLFNNLDRNADSIWQKKPILVYGESIQALIGLEVKKSTWRELLPGEYDAFDKEISIDGIGGKPKGFLFHPEKLEMMMNPSFKRTNAQRRNVLTMTMQPLEVIPFGADISRVIFFPKTPLQGMMKDHLTRISRIDTSYFNIAITILENNKKMFNAAWQGDGE